MEYPGPGKDYQKIYWSTSASVRENLPFRVSYVHRSSGTPKRVSLYESFYIDQPAIKIEEISCKLNVNPQAQSPDIMSPASPVTETPDGMQENFGASPAISDDSPTSETIQDGQIMDVEPVPLNCQLSTVNCYTTSTRKKKPNLFKKVLSYFFPFPAPDLAACGACKSRPRRKKA